ncbi:MAG: spore cortex-lytic enzyme [Bacillota bacterium]
MKRVLLKKDKAIGLIVATLLICVFILATVGDKNIEAVSLRPGNRGTVVTKIQQKLKDWGYYKGAVDGIYGLQTMYAVQDFQTKHGLTPDGVVGPATAAKLGVNLNPVKAATGATTGSTNVYLLAQLVHGEARGEPYTGKVAVAAVVLNRVDSAQFPNSVAGVIYQPGAFSVVADGQINLAPDADSLKAARDALNGWDPSNGCLFYYNPAKTTNKYMLSKPVLLVIGSHRFCR